LSQLPSLQVGVVGHRSLKAPSLVRRQVVDALRATVDESSPRPIAVLSSLAAGADQLFAEAALEQPRTTLAVVLPLSVAEYAAEFHDPAALVSFQQLLARAERVVECGDAPTRAAAYEQAARYIVDASDVLFALWDGHPSNKQGGTAASIAYARRRGHQAIRIIHVER
jgi:hypothetical protein